MSATKSAKGDIEVAVALELLAEYTEKLRESREIIASLGTSEKILSKQMATMTEVKSYIKNAMRLFEDLDRNVSQSIEFKDLHPLDRINLTLKLREFERELDTARRISSL